MKFKLSLSIFLITLTLSAQETLTPLRLLEKLAENNPQWQLGKINLKREYLDEERRASVFKPTLNMALTPAYSVGNDKTINSSLQINDLLTQSTGMNLSMGWRTPSQGTLFLSLSDTFIFASSEGETFLLQNPVLSLKYDQSVFTNGKFIEGRAYEAEKKINLQIPRARAELNYKTVMNSLISSKLSEYYNLLILNETYQLRVEETSLTQKELEQLSSMKDKGLFSGTDYWKKQLEMEQAADALLELKYQLNSSMEKLVSSLGGTVDQYNLPQLEITREMIPLPSKQDLFSLLDQNGDTQELRLQWETDQLTWEGGTYQRASKLSLSLEVSPQYSPNSTGADDFTASFTDFSDPDAWIQTSLSLSLNFSPSDWAANKVIEERDRLRAEMSRMNWENYRRELEEQLRSLLEKDEMLLKKLDRIEESIGYQELLLEKERKLLALLSSTPLAVERARLNWTTRLLDKKTALVEFSQNRLALLQLAGYDISTLDYRKLPGGTE